MYVCVWMYVCIYIYIYKDRWTRVSDTPEVNVYSNMSIFTPTRASRRLVWLWIWLVLLLLSILVIIIIFISIIITTTIITNHIAIIALLV